jgi:hypothetical protein
MYPTITPSAPIGASPPKGGEKGNPAMPNDITHCTTKNKTQASQLALTITSPSPLGGKLEGGPHAT